jgi:hypothetical protein
MVEDGAIVREQPRLLKGGALVLVKVDEGRAALLAFLRGTNAGWSGKDLARWLTTEYAAATSHSPERSPASQTRVATTPTRPLSIERVLLDTRARTIDLLRSLRQTPGHRAVPSSFGELVTPVVDRFGGFGFVPVLDHTMTLHERVGSLVAADCLTRPSDYECIMVCGACDEVSFRWEETHRATCTARASEVERASGTVGRMSAQVIVPKRWS